MQERVVDARTSCGYVRGPSPTGRTLFDDRRAVKLECRTRASSRWGELSFPIHIDGAWRKPGRFLVSHSEGTVFRG